MRVPSSRGVVVVNDEPGNRGRNNTARTLKVPPGHYPRAGQCRLWYSGRPPGQQPAATRCESLIGRVPRGAFILYNSNAWDGDYNWGEHKKQRRGAVPDIIVRLTSKK